MTAKKFKISNDIHKLSEKQKTKKLIKYILETKTC
jgi:hypothetical protein